MTRRRFLASVLAVTLAAVSIGAATAWISDSATLQYQISAASDFGDGSDGHEEEKVWVCKLAGPPQDPWVQPGKNPIHVGISSVDAQEGFADAHPSYIVDNGDVECEKPEKAAIEPPEDEGGESESARIGVEPDETQGASPSTTSTTSYTTSTTSTTSTTTTTVPAATTTAPNSDESTGVVTTTSTTSTTSTTTAESPGSDE